MNPRHLHIVCLDVPYPADYGGVFDLFYKIRALHDQGILIHLHCFEYGRGEQPCLQEFCEEVKYYRRNEGHKGFSHKLPYIVCSRSNPELGENLSRDNYPVLLEGIHCTYLLHSNQLKNRKVILRVHNVEHLYYRELFRSSHSLLKKLYYLHESRILRNYEKTIANKAFLVAVAKTDADLYANELDARQIDYLPVFLPYDEVRSPEGIGCFCLYHGNLSVPENEKAVCWILDQVFNELALPLVIAGKNPSRRLARKVAAHPQACLVADPSEDEMQDMIGKAQVHVLPSFNQTGIKIKILNALFNGRHCVVNQQAVQDTGLECVCRVGTDAMDFRKIISDIYTRPFGSNDIARRREILLDQYNNERNAAKLIRWIW